MYTVNTVQSEQKAILQKYREEKVMGKMRENPRYNVISMRISDEERDHLENIMEKTHLSISDIMREAMEFFAANYYSIDQQRKAA